STCRQKYRSPHSHRIGSLSSARAVPASGRAPASSRAGRQSPYAARLPSWDARFHCSRQWPEGWGTKQEQQPDKRPTRTFSFSFQLSSDADEQTLLCRVANGRFISAQTASRVRRYRFIPLTEPYIRATYTAHAINLPRTRGQ